MMKLFDVDFSDLLLYECRAQLLCHHSSVCLFENISGFIIMFYKFVTFATSESLNMYLKIIILWEKVTKKLSGEK